MKKNSFALKTMKNQNKIVEAIASANNTAQVQTMITTEINNLIANELVPDDIIISNLQTNSANIGTSNTFTETQTFSKNLVCTDSTALTNNNLTTKLYVDNKANSILSANNTFSGNNTYSNIPTLSTDLTASVTSDLQLTNKKYVDNKANSILSANNTFSGNNTYSNIPTLTTAKTIIDYTDDKQLTTQKYVNDKIANIYTSNNNFSGSNSYALIPTITTDLTASITNDLQLTNKKYVDNKANSILSANNTFSGNNTYNNALIYATDITANIIDNKHLTNKKYVDDKTNSIFSSDNSYSGNNIFSKINILNWAYIDGTGALINTNISGNTTFLGNLSRSNSFTATDNAFTFNTTPKISSGVTIDTDDANSILPKKEVKYLIISSNNYKTYAGDSTICYESGGFKYLKAPYINNINITTAGQSIVKKSVYFNFPSDPNGSDFTGAKIIGTRMTTIKIKYMLCQNDAILTRNGAYVSDGLGKLSRAGTQFDDLDFVPLTVSANNTLGSQPYPTFYFEGSLMVGLMRDSTGAISPYVRPLGQSTPNIINNTAGKTNATVASSFKTVAIQYVLTKYEFYPINFVYDQTKKKLKLNFNLPAILNDPSLNGFISSYDFYVEIDGAYSGYASSTDTLNKAIYIPSVILSDD